MRDSKQNLTNKGLAEIIGRYEVFISENPYQAIYRLNVNPPMSLALDTEAKIDWLLKNTIVAECNPVFAHMYGASTTQEVIGLTMRSLWGDDEELARDISLSFIRANYRWVQVEKLEQNQQGKKIWTSDTTFAQIKDGLLFNIWGIVVDITERKETEEKLQKSQGELKVLNERLVKSNTLLKKNYAEINLLKSQLVEENLFLQEEIKKATDNGGIIGESPNIHKTLQMAKVVAPTNSTVLITGESGTGKELIARVIHKNSERNKHPLIVVNCASIPNELFESEFFGHKKGAFTGAISDRLGKFKLADKGTIFLDEIGEIPIELQSKLLRVLQEQEFNRVGDENFTKVDVRVIAATNRDLESEARSGLFRLDLFYRLQVFPIKISPLRERKKDIPLLAEHFIQRSCTKLGKKTPFIEKIQMDILCNYSWPGNIRELQNIIERSIITMNKNTIVFDVPTTLSKNQKLPQKEMDSGNKNILTNQQLVYLEKQNILSALEAANWKVSGNNSAAELLGLNSTTLASKMKKFGIQRYYSAE